MKRKLVMERNLVVELHRDQEVVFRRRYARIDTAAPRCVQLAVLEGHVGDVFELSHAQTGLQIGTVRVGVRGSKQTINVAWHVETGVDGFGS